MTPGSAFPPASPNRSLTGGRAPGSDPGSSGDGDRPSVAQAFASLLGSSAPDGPTDAATGSDAPNGAAGPSATASHGAAAAPGGVGVSAPTANLDGTAFGAAAPHGPVMGQAENPAADPNSDEFLSVQDAGISLLTPHKPHADLHAAGAAAIVDLDGEPVGPGLTPAGTPSAVLGGHAQSNVLANAQSNVQANVQANAMAGSGQRAASPFGPAAAGGAAAGLGLATGEHPHADAGRDQLGPKIAAHASAQPNPNAAVNQGSNQGSNQGPNLGAMSASAAGVSALSGEASTAGGIGTGLAGVTAASTATGAGFAAPAHPAAAQTAQALRQAVSAGQQRVHLRLDPPELGRLDIRLTMVDGDVRATIMVEKPEAMDALRQELRQLDRVLSELSGRGETKDGLANLLGEERKNGNANAQGDGQTGDAEDPLLQDAPQNEPQDGHQDGLMVARLRAQDQSGPLDLQI